MSIKTRCLIALAVLPYVFVTPAVSATTVSNQLEDRAQTVPQQLGVDRETQRTEFAKASKAIASGQLSKARQIIKGLGDYPLVPYLQLDIMLRDLYRAPATDVEAFINQYAQTWAGEKARIHWLSVLFARKKYSEFIRHYPFIEPNTALRCKYLRSLLAYEKSAETEKTVYRQTVDIWLSGTSQPDSCDELFSQWRKSSHFDEEYIWQRFLLARQARQYGLARYLSTLVKQGVIKARIKLYHQLRRKPALVTNQANFDARDTHASTLIEYGLKRLATEDTDSAYRAFKQYIDQGRLDPVNQQLVIEALMKSWTKKGDDEKALSLALEYPESIREQQLDWQLQQSLKKLDWSFVLTWADFLDQESLNTDKWQYWIARSKFQQGESASAVLTKLAGKRSYYGHLANLLLEQPFYLQDSYEPSDPDILRRIRFSPGVQQAYELNQVGYYLNARNAWNVTLPSLSEQEHIAAGQVAHELGLHYSAIVSMAKTGSWQNLTIRFPLAYQQQYKSAAVTQGISLAWVYGISRQESSFAADIRSSAGARGLMQVMPGTAKEMAKKMGIRYDQNKLKHPEYNIPLGAAYLKQGMEELSGNMIYATAAYNAGIHRAKTWLKEDKGQLPLDVWAEIIPFKETRKYVKNVMDYSVIYADKLGIEAPLKAMGSQIFIGSPP